MPSWARSADAPTREEYHAERRRNFESIVPREPMRGIRELVARLTAAGVPAAIASSAPARWVVPAVTSIGMHVYSGTSNGGGSAFNTA